MTAYDLKREYKALYAPKNTDWAIVDAPEQRFIAVDGRGDPNTAEEYLRAVQALYSVAYTVKFAAKREGRDFVVGPLEGLWWADDPEAFTSRDKDSWQWTMMICQPEWIGASAIAEAKAAARAKKKRVGDIDRVYRKTLHEGTSAQVLHVGSYDDEGPILAELHEKYMPGNGLEFAGPHHEIYLSDPRKTEAARLRTVLRQPVKAA
ncbi:GyrI-like domain-containing protein [Glycomyces xiaoerkulensis]|uniref:GyrI-like domain-containing protein n=1 Tax=Glycomyces xiaoerkulensis TaxID=2038139 RepID=UPI000C26A64C|nr:GyrI-like domain-containing protein [Glycomyces xiaoerkulensis]